jgi:hypothetical protein
VNSTLKLPPTRPPVSITRKDPLESALGPDTDEKLKAFLQQQVGPFPAQTVLITSSQSIKRLIPGTGRLRTCIDLRPANRIKNLNKHFQGVNRMLPDAGLYIGCVETIVERKARFRLLFPSLIFKLVWLADFIIHRFVAKAGVTRMIYTVLTRDRYHVISKAEVLGRLSYCGYEIIGHETIGNLLYYSVMKTGKPRTGYTPSYGVIFKMNRIGKNGKMIGVYKIRTMHPYSEYLQDYVVKMNGYNKTGKPDQDFRLTSWGRLIRRLYLDEIPQMLNLLRGELNLVGVRPLSEFGFKALPIWLQKERILYKPGCIPPNVSLGITGFKGVIRAERIYLKALKKNGLMTNFRYFWMAIYNIITRKSVSS